MVRRLAARTLLFWTILLSEAAAAPPLAVTNHSDGDLLSCRVALLSGTLDPAAERVVAENLSSSGADRIVSGVAFRGRFKILVPLEIGKNRIALSSENGRIETTLFYRPAVEPVLRLIFFCARDEAALSSRERERIVGRLTTAARLFQTAAFERGTLFGEPGKTFALESDSSGSVTVRFLRGDKTAAEYRRMTQNALFDEIYRETAVHFPDAARNLVLLSFTRFNDAARRSEGVAARGGGNLALVGVTSFALWPESLDAVYPALTDTALRENVRFESAGRETAAGAVSATLGFAFHEIGHAFGLPDRPGDSAPKLDIMNQGFVHFGRIFLVREPGAAEGAAEITPDREPFLEGEGR